MHGFVYNGEDFDPGADGYGATPPAVGLGFLKGPVILPDDRDNDSDGLIDEAGERAGMQVFWLWMSEIGAWSADLRYKTMKGYWPDGSPITEGNYGRGGTKPTRFMFSGNPPDYWSEEKITLTGSRGSPADRVIMMTTGPFRLEPDDTEEIVIGIIFSCGRDRLESVYRLKADDALIQTVLDDLFQPRVPEAATLNASTRYALVHNYPNPFRDRTTLSYELPRQERVRLTVYDVLGREIETLVDGVQPPGVHEIEFEAGDFPPGIYFYELQAGLVRGAHRMVLLP